MTAPNITLGRVDSTLVSLDVCEHVATLELANPSNINALSEDMLATLIDAFDGIARRDDVRVVVLGSVSKHFCAGHNLKEMVTHRQDDDGGDAYFQALFAQCSSLMARIVTLPQPVIARVSGIATAAGCQLVAACDLAVASDEAKFATSGVNVGLFCSTPMVPLSRNLSPKHAMEMLLTGQFIPASRAAELGLINRVVPLAQLGGAALELAQEIAAKSPRAIRLGKQAFYRQLSLPLEQAYALAGQVMAENMLAQDATNGIQAFVAKQPMPQWLGK